MSKKTPVKSKDAPPTATAPAARPTPQKRTGTANPMNDGANEAAAAAGDEPPQRALAGDVDPLVDGTDRDQAGHVAAWTDPAEMIAAIERHAATSHGLSPDVELLKKIAGHLRVILDVPAAAADA